MKQKSPTLLVGAAEADFTPAPGLSLLGQMHERRARRTRDPLTANAVAFRQDRQTVVLVSVDICILNNSFVKAIQAKFARCTGLPGSCLLLHSTHTHVAPTVFDLLTARADPAFVRRVGAAILTAARRALAKLQEASVFSGLGHTEHLGWNRRAMFADGSSRMYGHAQMPGFIGMEGPRDPALGVLCARDHHGAVRAVIVNFSTHPNCLEAEWFYSADLPGETRRVLKAALGAGVVVVYLTGAAGNTAPSLLDPHMPEQPWRGEAGVIRSGQYLGGEALKMIAGATMPMSNPKLRLAQTTLQVPLRCWPEASARIFPEPLKNPDWRSGAHEYYMQAQAEWPHRMAVHSPWPVRLNVLCVGDAVIATNPAELFVEYGLEMRRRSPACVTLVSELTDGYCGYVPTRRAFRRGGYETWPAPTSQLEPKAGDQIVRATQKLLQKVFARNT
ncbi:MAG: hypothetical protein HY360_12255 [Verrucomicrobia bacterium]|nr:hypothetical protein [Verrucomicrobiota bacterium]